MNGVRLLLLLLVMRSLFEDTLAAVKVECPSKVTLHTQLNSVSDQFVFFSLKAKLSQHDVV